MKVITNYQYRNMVYGYELTPKERQDFDYIDADDFDSHDFFRYMGQIYDVNEAERSNVAGWDGQFTDTFFSAILIKLDPEGDRIMVGRCYS
jgi:hypothetical protein